ncbi:MAG: hypothetical protein ACE5JN_08290 [Candidatus Methylomirabilia bacterium]
MAFRKIRETVEAFRTAPFTHDEKLDQYEQELRSRFEKKEPANTAINIAVLVVVVLPCSYLLALLLSKVFSLSTDVGGIVTSMVLTYLLFAAHGRLFDKLQEVIPFYKLNPYFGSKLEETIAAFRRERKPSESNNRAPALTKS